MTKIAKLQFQIEVLIKMIQNNKSETITVQLGDENQIEVDVAWLATHSKMVQTMLNQSGMKKVTSIQLISIPNLIHWYYFQATIFGHCDWIWDKSDAELNPVWFNIIQSLDYLDIELLAFPQYSPQLTPKYRTIRYYIWLELLAPYIQTDTPQEYKELYNSSENQCHWNCSPLNPVVISTTYHAEYIGRLLNGEPAQKYYSDLLVELKSVRHHLVFLRLMLGFKPGISSVPAKHMIVHTSEDPEFGKQLARLAPEMEIWQKKWPSGLVLAGGAMATVLTDRDVTQMNPSEDLDFWIYGSNEEERRSNFRKGFDFLTSDILPGTKHYYVIQAAMVTILVDSIEGPKRPRQLIYTDFETPQEIINRFDLAHVQAYYDGHQQILGYSDQAEIFYQTKMINLIKDQSQNDRLFKLLRYDPTFSPEMVEDFRRCLTASPATAYQIPITAPLKFSSKSASITVPKPEPDKLEWSPDFIEQLKAKLLSKSKIEAKMNKYWEFPAGLNFEREMHLLSLIFDSCTIVIDKQTVMDAAKFFSGAFEHYFSQEDNILGNHLPMSHPMSFDTLDRHTIKCHPEYQK